MKKLNIPSTFVGLVMGLFTAVVVYLFVPPPQTASADYHLERELQNIMSHLKYQLERDVKEWVGQVLDDKWSGYGGRKEEIEDMLKKYCG